MPILGYDIELTFDEATQNVLLKINGTDYDAMPRIDQVVPKPIYMQKTVFNSMEDKSTRIVGSHYVIYSRGEPFAFSMVKDRATDHYVMSGSTEKNFLVDEFHQVIYHVNKPQVITAYEYFFSYP